MSNTITGRRLDNKEDSSNLIVFKATPDFTDYNLSRTLPNPRTENAGYLKQQDVRDNIEKLKFRRNEPKLTSRKTHTHALQNTINNTKSAIDQKRAVSVSRNVVNIRRDEYLQKPHKISNENVETRKKKAVEWLQNEKKENDLKMLEKKKLLESAKELELKRRQHMQAEAQRKRQLQMELLQLEYDLEGATDVDNNANTFVPKYDHTALNFEEKVSDVQPQLHRNMYMSTESGMIIDKLAETLSMLKPVTHRPIVPRLSRNYVNRNSLIIKEAVVANAEIESAVPTTRLQLNKHRAVISATDAGDDDEQEEDYGLDTFDDVDQPAAAVASKEVSKGGVQKDNNGATDDEDVHAQVKDTKVDLITARELELAKKRRETGKLFAKQQHARILQKEKEERLKEGIENEKRKIALEQLRSRVSTINQHNETTVHLKVKSGPGPRGVNSSRVFQYSEDGHDFHSKFQGRGEIDSFDDISRGNGFSRSHLLEEEDVPLRDFLMPPSSRPPPTVTINPVIDIEPTKTPSIGLKGIAPNAVRLPQDIHSQTSSKKKDSLSNITPTSSIQPAPFRFNKWSTGDNSIAKSHAYQNPVANISAGPAHQAVVRSKTPPTVRPNKTQNTALGATANLFSNNTKLVSKEKKRRKKGSRSKTNRSQSSVNVEPPVKHGGRSVMDYELDTEVLELLNRSDISRQPDISNVNTGPNSNHRSTPPRAKQRVEPVTSVQKLFTQHAGLELPSQQPLDVSRMVQRNFTEVKKVISEVDRMCEMLNAQTALLEQKLSVRESVTIDVNTIRSALKAKIESTAASDTRADSGERAQHRFSSSFYPSDEFKQTSSEDHSENSGSESQRVTEEEVFDSRFQRAFSPDSINSSSQEDDDDQTNSDDSDDDVLMRDRSSDEESESSVGSGDDDNDQHMRDLPMKSSFGQPRLDLPPPTVFEEENFADPVLRHQLGLVSDRRSVVDKYSRFADAIIQDDRDRHANTDKYHTKNADPSRGQLLKPLPLMNVSSSKPNEPLPSLRNVGELATLLRANYNKLSESQQIESESEDEDRSEGESDDPENDFRAVSVMARAIAQQQRLVSLKKDENESSPLTKKNLESSSAFKLVDISKVSKPISVTTSLENKSEASDEVKETDSTVSASPLSFWDSMLNRPLKHDLSVSVSLSDSQLQDLRGATSVLFSEQTIEHNVLRGHEQMSASTQAVKRSGADMRLEMLEELRRQDEYFNYTLELAEIEKANALHNAKELSQLAKTRSEAELNQLKLQQEIELQKVAYENALAISMANSHLVAEKSSMTQKEELLRLQSQLNFQQIQSEYALLLAQAGTVSDNLELNQKLVLMEQMMRDEKDKFLLSERERLLGEERERLVAVSKEQERIVALERDQLVAAVQRQQQQHQVELAKKELEAKQLQFELQQQRASVEVTRPALPSSRQSGLIAGHQLEEVDSYDEYSADSFEHASVSRSNIAVRSGIPIPQKITKPIKQEIVEDSIATEVEYSTHFSAHSDDDDNESIPEDSASESEDDDRVNLRDKTPLSEDESVEEEQYESSSFGQNKAAHLNVVRKNEDIESSIEEDEVLQTGEISSSIEDHTSPIKVTRIVSTYKHKQHQSSDDEEVDEVSEQLVPSDEESSIIEEANEDDYSEEEYEEYSDTFESKMSIADSVLSSAKKNKPHDALSGIGKLPSAKQNYAKTAPSTVEELKRMKASLLEASATSSSSGGGAGSVDDAYLSAMLLQYQNEMEMRLRALDETHELRVEFLRKKHEKRLAALELLSSDKEITRSQLKAEKQRIDAQHQEDTAKLQREKWALNAKAYKEDRKFRELKREMALFRANLNDEAAAAEMKEQILGRASNLEKHHTAAVTEESYDSLSDSSDSHQRRQKAHVKADHVDNKNVSNIKSVINESVVDHSYIHDDFEVEEESQRSHRLQMKAHSLLHDEDSIQEEEVEEEDKSSDSSEEIVEELEKDSRDDSQNRSIATASSYSVSDDEPGEKSKQYADFDISNANDDDDEVEDEDVEYSDTFAEESEKWGGRSQTHTTGIASTVQQQSRELLEASQSRAEISVAYGDDFEQEDFERDQSSDNLHDAQQPVVVAISSDDKVVHVNKDEEQEDDEIEEDIIEELDDNDEGNENESSQQMPMHDESMTKSAILDIDIASNNPPLGVHKSELSHEVSSSYIHDDSFESIEASNASAINKINKESGEEGEDDNEIADSFSHDRSSHDDDDRVNQSITPDNVNDDKQLLEDEEASYEQEEFESEADNEEEDMAVYNLLEKNEMKVPQSDVVKQSFGEDESDAAESIQEEIEEDLESGDSDSEEEDVSKHSAANEVSLSISHKGVNDNSIDASPLKSLSSPHDSPVVAPIVSDENKKDVVEEDDDEASYESEDFEQDEDVDDVEKPVSVEETKTADIHKADVVSNKYDVDEEESIAEEIHEEENDEESLSADAKDNAATLLHVETQDNNDNDINDGCLSPMEQSPSHAANENTIHKSNESSTESTGGRDTNKNSETGSNRSRLSTVDSADDSANSSMSAGALEESKEFELDLKDKKTLHVELDHTHQHPHHLNLHSAGIAAVNDQDTSQMYFDKETQRWVGGDEISLDGFEESADERGLSPLGSARRRSLSLSHSNSKSGSPIVGDRKGFFRDLRPEATSRDNSLRLDGISRENSSSSASTDEDDNRSRSKPKTPSPLTSIKTISVIYTEPEPLSTVLEHSILEDEIIPEDIAEDVAEEGEDGDESGIQENEKEVTQNTLGLGVDDSFLSAVSEDNNVSPMLPAVYSPFEADNLPVVVQSSDSDKTIQWNSQQTPDAAVIVTENVLSVSTNDESMGKNIDDSVLEIVQTKQTAVIDESFDSNAADLSLDAMLDDIESEMGGSSVVKKKDSTISQITEQKLELSYDNSVEGSLSDSDFSVDFIENCVELIPIVAEHKSAEDVNDANERRVDEITDLLMKRLLEESLAGLSASGVDIQQVIAGYSSPKKTNDAVTTSSEPTTPRGLEDSGDSQDELSRNIRLFVEKKAEQFQSRLTNVPSNILINSASSPPSSPVATLNSFSLSSLKSMPSLASNNHKRMGRHSSISSHSSSGSEDSSEYVHDNSQHHHHGFDEALSSVGDDVSPVKAHPDISADIPKEVSDLVHNKVETIDSIVNTETNNEIKVQDILHHTEDFLDAVFADTTTICEQLVEKLRNPNHEGPFISYDQMNQLAQDIDEGGDEIHKGAILDRINEICDELFSLKHNPKVNTINATLGQRMIAQTLPMNSNAVSRHIKQHILDDQHTLVKLLKGEKGLHELLNITTIDVFKEETRTAIQDCSDQIADILLARLLINTVVEVGSVVDLTTSNNVASKNRK